jgi:antagonist of KipI
LFDPGDQVRFVPSEEPRGAEPKVAFPTTRRPVLEVLAPGAHTTVQDLGRTGFAHYGVGKAGAFDLYGATAANALAGNPDAAALLELALSGPSFRVLANTTVALAGTDFGCRIDGVPVPTGISWFVRSGSTISFSTPRQGLRGYLAVAGGLDVPVILGSRSTSAYGGFGGYAGRVLRAGDVLGSGAPSGEPASLAGRIAPIARGAFNLEGEVEVRYVPFRGAQSPGAEPERAFLAATWSVSERSNRMGLRLAGDSELSGGGGELASFPVVPGAIQLPPDGSPIVLGPDHQTTGGYPVLGVVAGADLALLSQAGPGTKLRFKPLQLAEARALSDAVDVALRAGLRHLRPSGDLD